MTDAIIEAAARALAACGFYDNEATAAARTMLAAVTPLIEAAALEKAAKLVEEGDGNYRWAGRAAELAAAIRALIVKDSGGGD
jgi:hypothetical protein